MRDGYDTEHKLHMLFRYMCILNSSMHMVDDNAGNQNCVFMLSKIRKVVYSLH